MATRREKEVNVTAIEAQEAMVEQAISEIDEEEIFEGGPTQSLVDVWKEKYGQVYMTEIDENSIFIWRVLTRKEFKEVMKIQDADAMYREERVAEMCIVWPEDYTFAAIEDGKAGIPTILSEQIMEKSGFAPRTGPIAL